MLAFLAKHPPKTKISHLDQLTLDGGRSAVEFKRPGDRYLVVNRLPPALSSAEAHKRRLPHKAANTSLAPPLHRHFWQNEYFHVLSGTAKFTIGSGQAQQERLVSAGEPVVTIPKRQLHTFCNASEEAELVVEFVLDPASRQTDEAYFRNVWGYRNDCSKAGIPRSIFQQLAFMHRGGVVMALPGPDAVSSVLGLLLNYIGGRIIGTLLLGYRDSYPEYYHDAAS